MSDDFVKNICRTVGHEWKKNPDLFADECDRCGVMVSWMSSKASLKKIADAMAAPLKANLDYQAIGKKIYKVETWGDVPPIYDNDLPNQEPQA